MDLDGRNGRAGGKNFLKRDKKRFFSKKDEKKEKRPTVSTFAMFRYSDWLDRLYIVLGTLAAIIHGTGFPLIMLVFGDMTDSFAGAGNFGNITFSNMTNESELVL
ncbi:ATP-dependent translocase ABCB1-like [Bos indicus]|uniref:ATP-dependent translocase ABCB1-like n=1 Tax=Bos indicus TaxID=9915 RepID=A0ABM4S7D9_BOSIN